MAFQYNPWTNDLEYVPDMVPPQQLPIPQQQSAGQNVAGAIGGIAGTGAGVYGVNALTEALAGAPLAAEAATGLGAAGAGAGTIAASGTQLGAAAPTLLAPSIGATSAAASPAVAAPAGLTGWGSVAAPVAAIAGPLITGKLIESTFFKQKPKREFNASEVAQDMGPGHRNLLANQIKGYDQLGQAGREKLLTALHDNKVLALAGAGNSDGTTAERKPEYISWGKYLTNPRESTSSNRRNNKYYYAGGAAVPTADEINNAHWLNDDRKSQLLDVLNAINAVGANKGGE